MTRAPVTTRCRALLAAVTLLALAACDALRSVAGLPPECIWLSIGASNGTTIAVGDSTLLMLSLNGPGVTCVGANHARWEIERPEVVRISSVNMVYGLTVGATDITAIVGEHRAHARITVAPAAEPRAY